MRIVEKSEKALEHGVAATVTKTNPTGKIFALKSHGISSPFTCGTRDNPEGVGACRGHLTESLC